MSIEDAVVLVIVLVAFAAFGVTLNWLSHK